MLSNRIVISKNHMPVHRSIVDHAIKMKEYITDFYTEEYGPFIDELNHQFAKLENVDCDSKGQLQLEFDIDAILAYKVLIYLYIENEYEKINKTTMLDIIEILRRLDDWVDDLLNVDGEMKVVAYRYENNKNNRL